MNIKLIALVLSFVLCGSAFASEHFGFWFQTGSTHRVYRKPLHRHHPGYVRYHVIHRPGYFYHPYPAHRTIVIYD